MSSAEARGPLRGIRILDLTQMLAGPYCTMLLGDLGAEVLKVEAPAGDGARRFGPFHPEDDERHYGGYFQSINRGKQSIAVDLKAPEGVAFVRRLAGTCDVLVENFREGVLDRMGLGYEELAEDYPRLVYAAVRGFGDRRTGESPYADWPAFDLTAQAMGGFLSITGEPDQPMKSGPGIGDIFPGTLLAVGILAALQERERSGLGQFVDVAMYDAVLALSERLVHQYAYTGEVPGRTGNEHPLLSPFDVLATSDGHVTVASPSDAHWVELCALMGRPELADDPRFASNDARVANADAVRAACGEWTGARTTAEVVAVLGGRVPVGPVNDMAAIAADPHAAAREMIVSLPHPGASTPVAVAGAPVKLTRTPSVVDRRAPLLSEHAREIAALAGYDDEALDHLVRAGVVTIDEKEVDGCNH
jgi:crotonobetainyl-CoA:carnitine CoA-transferase CaiB-like acyl-CoA transferase